MSVASSVIGQTGGSSLDHDHPWPGLSAFEERDQAFFVGRDEELATLHRLVRRQRLTVLFGQSGLGKTSLLQAGVFPLLREQDLLPVRILLAFDDQSAPLLGQVRQAIADAAAAADVQCPSLLDATDSLWEAFHRRDADFWSARNRLVLPVLVFDQFEEIFTVGRERPERSSERRELLIQLADLIEGRPPAALRRRLAERPGDAAQFDFDRHKYKIVVSLREDYLADLDGMRKLMPSLAGDRLRIEPLKGPQALTIVTEPGRKVVERETAEAVVRFAAGLRRQPEATLVGNEIAADAEITPLEVLRLDPSLLSLFCRELNGRRGEQRISNELIRTAGTQILADFYEASIADQPSACRTFIEDSLLTTSGHRDSVAFERAVEILGSDKVISTLVGRRLLRLEERGGQRRVELTHDVLADIVTASRDQRRRHEEQQRQVEALQAAEDRVRAARRQLQQTRATVVLLAVLFAAAVGALLWGWARQREAVRARMQAEAALGAAEKAKQETEAALTEAELAKRQAETALTEADGARVLTEAALAETERARRAAEGALAEAERAGRQEQTALSAAQLAKNQTSTALAAGDLVQAQNLRAVNIPEALAYLARSLRLDPTNLSTRALAFDYLTSVPLRRLEFRHGPLNAAGFSADGARVVTVSPDGSAQIWDTRTGQAAARLAHPAPVRTALFSTDGLRILTTAQDGIVRIWDAATGQALHTLPRANSPGYTAAVSRDGAKVVVGLQDGTARIWDPATGRTLTLRPQRPATPPGQRVAMTAVGINADGTRVLTGFSDGTAQAWDAGTGQAVGESLRHRGIVYVAIFSPDSARMVTASSDGMVRLWETQAAKPLLVGSFPHKGAVHSAAFSRDGTRIVTGSQDGTAQIFDTRMRRIGAPLQHQSEVRAAAFDPTGTILLTASVDGAVRTWDARPRQATSVLLAHGDVVRAAGFSQDGTRVVTVTADGTAGVWDAQSGHHDSRRLPHEGAATIAAFSRDGTRLLLAAGDGAARVWDTETGESVGARLEHQQNVEGAAFNVDGTRIVTVSADGTARVWDARTGQPATPPLVHQGRVAGAVFSPDGSLVLTRAGNAAHLWDTRTGQQKALPHAGPVVAASFSPDGTRVGTASADLTARLWDAQSGRPIGPPLQHPVGVIAVALGPPDGAQLATISRDGTARIWGATTGQLAGRPLRRRDLAKPVPMLAVTFSVDGTRVLTASQDGTAMVWDARTGQPLTAALQHLGPGRITSAAFSLDGTRVLTSTDRMACVWDVQAGTQDDSAPLAELAELAGGLQLSTTGGLEQVDDVNNRLEALRVRAAGAELGQPGAAAFIRWFFEDPWTRSVSPLSKMTVTEYIDAMIAMGGRGRAEAERAFFGHPRFTRSP